MANQYYRLNKEIFTERANKKHNNKYDYSKVEYKNHRTKVCITCPIHGDFWQTPKNHMNGQGCPECGKKYAIEYKKRGYTEFIASSKSRFGDSYEFPNIEKEYENSHSKITIKCKKCGNTFVKIACDHITSQNGGCKHYYPNRSFAETEIADFIKKNINGNDILINDRSFLKGNELDILIPSMNLAIEYNGLYWHSNKPKNYHLMKTEACESRGYRLIQIFEDEYISKKDVLFSKLKHILGVDYNLPKIYGRKCQIREIEYAQASDFLEKNHIQGKAKSTVYLGAFYNDSLCGVMTFINKKNGKWELNRFATDITKRAIGVASKIFKYFIKVYDPIEIKSFADRRWTTNLRDNLYTKLGFNFDSTLRPDYKYQINGVMERLHKFGFRKKILSKKYGLPMTMTETEMTESLGAKKIWDCGLLKYIWKKDFTE